MNRALAPEVSKALSAPPKSRIKEMLALAAVSAMSHCGTDVHAQAIQIKLVDGKTGHPITYVPWLSPRTIVQAGLGRDSDLSLSLTADKQGVVPLRFSRTASEINVSQCEGKHAEWQKLPNSENKKNREEFNKRYKSCTNFSVNNPIMKFADSISSALSSERSAERPTSDISHAGRN